MAPPVGERILAAWEAIGVTSCGPLIKTSTYKGVKQGDTILIDDLYWPQLKGVKFKFVAYVHNVESGIGWLEVFGGPTGKQWIRSFPVHAARVVR